MGNASLSFGVNWKSVLLGGLVAGLVLIGFGILDVTASERNWMPWLENLNRTSLPFTTAFQGAGIRVPLPFLSLTASISAIGIVLELFIGLWTVWLYAAISFRYGQGPKTAVVGGLAAGLMIAVVTFSSLLMAGTVMGAILSLVVYLVTIVVATTAGSLLYKDAGWVDQPERAVPAEPAPVPTPQPSAAAPSARSAPPASSPERTVSYADSMPAVDQQAPPVPAEPAAQKAPPPPVASSPPPAAPKAPPPPASSSQPPAAPKAPASTLKYAESPPDGQAKAASAPPSAAAPPPAAAAPASPPQMDAQHQQLHETVVALELNIEVAVREVLRIFGKEPLSVDEIVQHLSAVRWDFGELHPRVATNEALKKLVTRGGAKKEDGKYMFARA